MSRLCSFSRIGLLLAVCACGDSARETIDTSRRELAGTPARIETEYKFAFTLDDEVAVEPMLARVRQELEQLVGQRKLGFSQLVRQKARVEDFQRFLFLDIYLDTPDRAVLAADSCYRLRYRWKTVKDAVLHDFAPLPPFHPIRCEVQAKTNYQAAGADGLLSVTETRFEFRNESEPFAAKRDAPPAPWPRAAYEEFAAQGRFRGYFMRPMAALMQALKVDEPPAIRPVLDVSTTRHRTHVSVPNPWGGGPNPEQVFIVTLDRSRYRKACDGCSDTFGEQAFWELEVEIDRSTLDGIQRGQTPDGERLQASPFRDAAVAASKRAEVVLEADRKLVLTTIARVLEDTPGMRKLPLGFKYARMSKALDAR